MPSNKAFLLLLFVTSSIASSAQDEWKKDSLAMPARHAIKINLLQPFSFYPTIPLAYEMRLAPRLSVQLEAGYAYEAFPTDRYFNKRGAKLRTALRWYPGNLAHTARTHDYLSLEPYLNVINFDRHNSQWECFDVECQQSFLRVYDAVVRYRESGLAIKWGHISYGRHMLYDFNVGARLRRVRYLDAPPAVGDPWAFNLDLINEKDRVAIGIVLGFSLGWRIK